MSIKQCVVFQGGYLQTYQDEIDEVIEEFGGTAEGYNRLDLGSIDPIRSLSEVHVLDEIINDDSLLFYEERTLLLDQVNAWKAADVNALVKKLTDLETQWSVVMILHSGEPLASVKNIKTTDGEGIEVIDRRLPIQSEQSLAKWIEEWLEERDVKLERGVALEFAGYVAEDIEQLVTTLVVIAEAGKGQTLDMDGLLKQAGSAGMVPIFMLTKQIAQGDKEAALDALGRIMTQLHPLAVLSVLRKRYRGYAAIVDAGNLDRSEIAALTGSSPAAATFVGREASTLGRSRIVSALVAIMTATNDCKGGSGLDDETIIQILVTSLAQQFRSARR